MSEPIRVVVMGTGPFAVPMFRALLASRFEMVALVTQPLREGRSHRPLPKPPMRELAEQHRLPIFDPVSINTPEAREQLASWQADLFVVADYGQILAPETLATARLGGINLHGSLLPKYRGAAPINWAIYRSERETGVTVIHMTPQVDAGPCIAQASIAIGDEETAPELEHRLAELGGPLIVATIERLLRGECQPLPQVAAQASSARRLRKSDGEVDWQQSAEQIARQVRAFEPWPRTSTSWHRDAHPPLRLILGPVMVLESQSDAPPGTVLRAAGNELQIATGSGVAQLRRVQPAGKRMLEAGEFLRGYPLQPGDRLGPDSVGPIS